MIKPSYFTAVWISILAGAGLIVVTYLIARETVNSTVAVAAAFLLAIDPVHWLCSEKIWIESSLALFFHLALLFFILAVKRDKSKFFIAAGIFAGLAVLSKYPGGIILPVIFSYLYLSRPELICKVKSWFLWLIPVLMFIPWMIWNYSVYGGSFLAEMLTAHYPKYELIFTKVSHPQTLSLLGLSLLGVMGLLLGLRIKVEKSALFFNYFILALILTGALFVSASPDFRRSLINMIDLFYLPRAGWQIGMFKLEPWYFYFMRLIELSPFYLFSFIGLLFFLKQTGRVKLLSLSVIWVMTLFIILRNFQSRYILLAMPSLLILAGDTMVKIWQGLKARVESGGILVSARVFLILLIVFFFIKTIIIDLKLAVPNWPCYF